MDAERIRRLSRLQARGRGDRGIQRQVDERPVGAARLVAGDATGTHARDVPQLLPLRHALAVHRHPAGFLMTRPSSQAWELAASRDEILRGLRAEAKTIAPKFFYDDRGARLFQEIC